ncbi:MAG TPA: ROK family transcriptional regulator [bacterium]|nr:ROK family transcriptional regulator [bacterium]HOH07398.1 ROK family transcriptional regulator [bacterium]HOY43847.1 ROK family transcriptional regulator [bacterium]HPG84276.1 ROK family transcriptional regulator [bacterium]HPM59257.1 ROK family transcriptional regulator [bacterium]
MKKIITGDYRLVKNLNSHIVLNLIRTRGPIYGADLAKITGMRPSTIMSILRNLEKKGLIFKSGTGASSVQGGRKPTLWEICGNYGYIIGLQIELNEVHGVLIDLNSHVLARSALPVEGKLTLEDLQSYIFRIVDTLLTPQKISRKNLLGMGIGVSGLVDYRNGVIVNTALMGKVPVSLKAALDKHYDFPILVENDANAAAMCEKWYGKGKNISDLIYMLLVMDQHVFGVGYGLYLEDQIYRGAHMFAGETAPQPISIKQMLEKVAPEYGGEVLLNGRSLPKERVTLQDLIDAALNHDSLAIRYFQELAKIVARELAHIINLLDPEMILLGGEVSKVGDLLLNAVRSELKADARARVSNDLDVKIETSTVVDAVAMGATTLILQNIFKSPVLQAKNYL